MPPSKSKNPEPPADERPEGSKSPQDTQPLHEAGDETAWVDVGGAADASKPPPAADRATRTLPAHLGPYRILGMLGEGGMGVVYEAEQPQPRRRVALKVIRGGQFVDASRVRMFQREVETLARLKHPRIGAIYDAGCTDTGEHYFAMELVRGKMLDEFLQDRPTVADAKERQFRLRLFLSICDAVNYAHLRGVIHRDLKPSNIVVTDVAASGKPVPTAAPAQEADVKILDFGLARITESDRMATITTEVGVIQGTLPYMSPEQTRAQAEEIDVRSDVYALGVILYEMLTGARPYDTQSVPLMEALRVIVEEPAASLSAVWPTGGRPDADLETIVQKALEKEPERRYGSAAALAEDLQRYLESRPILARPPSTLYQVRMFARRRRALVGGVLATAVALVLGTVASTTLGFRAAAQRRAAEHARDNTEAVVSFQQNMLREIDPNRMGQGLGEDLRARLSETLRVGGESPERIEQAIMDLNRRLATINLTDVALGVVDRNILARALDAAADRFATRPHIRARLMESVATTYYTLGMMDRADSTCKLTEALYDSLLGPGSQEAWNVASMRANTYTMRGRHVEAENLLRTILADRRHTLAADDERVFQTMNDLALVLADMGEIAEAESLYIEAGKRTREVLGKENPAALATMANYAWLLTEVGRLQEAESLGTRVLAMRRRVLGNENPETMQSVNNLAVLYRRLGRLNEAEKLYLEDYEVSRRLLGDDNPDLLATGANLGRLYLAQEKYQEAEAILRRTLATAKRIMPPEFFGTGYISQSYGEALVQLGRAVEAEPYLLDAHRILLPVLGPAHDGVQRCVRSLVDLYEMTERHDQALAWREGLIGQP